MMRGPSLLPADHSHCLENALSFSPLLAPNSSRRSETSLSYTCADSTVTSGTEGSNSSEEGVTYPTTMLRAPNFGLSAFLILSIWWSGKWLLTASALFSSHCEQKSKSWHSKHLYLTPSICLLQPSQWTFLCTTISGSGAVSEVPSILTTILDRLTSIRLLNALIKSELVKLSEMELLKLLRLTFSLLLKRSSILLRNF
ncbi:hypothetical protein OGAPHI_005218 [Ogataea philodendri]|uniref:Uncharacterized protein n=1 Tax=Ogataea philodendri TaxID=1378263 RepID=A0A9P8T3A9_9ASCO|nr:uncharacterized protein OGAPHI_005218 [Ogataea philodendri]KAH3663815.1 hypothetical protein OGAPHI_005218 [Ogataea philodendri]